MRKIYVQDGMYVLPENFRFHIKYLKNRFRFISLKDICGSFGNYEKLFGTCHITFDDGWRDNFTNAFPILSRSAIPASIFLATDYIDTDDVFWPEKLSLAMQKFKNIRQCENLSEISRNILDAFEKNGRSYEQKVSNSIEAFKNYPDDQIQSCVRELLEAADIKSIPGERQLLNWNEIRKMSEIGIEFGSHTRGHKILTNEGGSKTIVGELIGSKQDIEKKIKKKVDSFCFPNGNSSSSLRNLVAKSGYKCAFTGESGLNGALADPYSLKRIGIHNDVSDNLALFACRIVFPIFRK